MINVMYFKEVKVFDNLFDYETQLSRMFRKGGKKKI